MEADEKAPEDFLDEGVLMRGFDEPLHDCMRRGVPGTVTLVVCQGWGVEVEKVGGLEKLRVG